MAVLRVNTVLLGLRLAAGFELSDLIPDIDLPDLEDLERMGAEHLPDMSGVTKGMSIETGSATDFVERCKEEDFKGVSNGWPTALDWGLYWFGPNGESKKAKPRQQAKPLEPLSWYQHSDEYPNSTERYKAEFYDSSRKTVIFFHGYTGADSWFPQQCRRLGTTCDRDLCPDGTKDFMEGWIEDGWNVGYFYWDQFANELCTRDAEQKIWFDRKGDGLAWSSYQHKNHSTVYQKYLSKEISVTEMCETAITESMGDFFSGRTVRFVGYGIGAQLAAACASRLHLNGHVAAPQRIAMLEPYWTTKEAYFLGVSVRCGLFTSEDGIDGFVQEATVGFVKGLWNTSRVVTEIYASTLPKTNGMAPKLYNELENHALITLYDPTYCHAVADKECKHKAVLPLYFLGYGAKEPLLIDENRSVTNERLCHVPSAACSDEELRVRIAQRLEEAERALAGRKQLPDKIWAQVRGGRTLDPADDVYAYDGEDSELGYTPRPKIEKFVALTAPMRKRRWGLRREIQFWPEAGMSLPQLHFGLSTLVVATVLPLLAGVLYATVAFAVARCRSTRKDADEEEEEDMEPGSSECDEAGDDAKE